MVFRSLSWDAIARRGTDYQKLVLKKAGPEVKFLGPIFDRDIVKALRFYARAYFHGHQVGGTNPSLVESWQHPMPSLRMIIGSQDGLQERLRATLPAHSRLMTS